jgi:hypothetical protein
MVLPHSHYLRRRTKKGDCALARTSEGRDSASTARGEIISSSSILRTRNSAGRQDFVYGPPSADCADFAHCIGEIAESAKLLVSFSQSVQKLHRHTFSSAK